MATRGTDLPTLPDPEADPQHHLNFVNRALRRKWNLIARVRKYGNVAPTLVLVFENYEELRLSAAQHKYGGGLRDTMHAYDGIVCPAYTKPQLEVIFAALIKAADLYEMDSDMLSLTEEIDGFLSRCLEGDDEPLRRPREIEDRDGELFAAVSDLREVNRRRTGKLEESPPILLFWTPPALDDKEPETELWIPRGALLNHLRATRSPYVAGLRNMLLSLGWRMDDVHLRAKSDWSRRARAKIWVVPVPWEPAELDLQYLSNRGANGGRGSTSPDGSLRSNAREGEPRARVRRGGDVGGRSHNPRKQAESG